MLDSLPGFQAIAEMRDLWRVGGGYGLIIDEGTSADIDPFQTKGVIRKELS